MARVVALIALVATFVIGATARVARADGDTPSYRAVVDRVELEPSSITGSRLKVYLSALSLDGQMLDLTDPKSIRLYVGSSQRNVPYALGRYAAQGDDTAIVVLVQATQDFADALPTIADALDRELLGKLGEHAQIAVAMFGDAAGVVKLAPAKVARGKLAALQSDASVGDPALLDAIERALIVLRKANAPKEGETPRTLRKLILVVGDGRDRAGDRDRVTAVGKRAAKEGVRIHALAYSPSDVRRPLLALGELAKRSLGTFRWPGRGRKPGADSWSEAFRQLYDEIDHQYVITYFVTADDDVAGKKLHVVTVGRTEATSNEVKIPEAASCGGAACDPGAYCSADKCFAASGGGGGRGVLGWLAIIAGVVVGSLLVLGLVGFVMSRRGQAQPPPQFPPGFVPPPQAARPPKPVKQKKQKAGPAVVAPGLLPNGRPIPALMIMNGPRANQRLLLRDGFAIGKQPGVDLQIEDGYTSSLHAQIAMDRDGNCKIVDRGSTNGTFVNEARITEAPLVHGCAIRIGSTQLYFLAQ